MSKPNGSMIAVFFALGGNTLIAIIKFIVYSITNSSGMLAEAIHSTADCLNQIFLLVGNKRSKKKPTEWHSFGYERESFFWSLMVAIFLFFVGSLFSIYEGIHKIIQPEPLHDIYWVFVVLVISIIIESKSFMVAYKEFRKKSKGSSFYRAIEDSTDTSLMVILLEDFAALSGLIIVLITTSLSMFYPVFDAIGSIFVGLLLISVAYKLADEIRRLIIGESIPRNDRIKIKNIINKYDLVEHINRIQTQVIGNDKYMVLISIDIDDESKGYKIEDVIDKIKMEILEEIPEVKMISIDIQDPNKTLIHQ